MPKIATHSSPRRTCKNGHPRTPENMGKSPSTQNKCLVCLRETVRKSRMKKKGLWDAEAERLDLIRERLEDLGLDPSRHRRFERMEKLADHDRRAKELADSSDEFLIKAVYQQVHEAYLEYRAKYPEVARVLDELGSFDVLDHGPTRVPQEPTHCRNGHPINEENSYRRASGMRMCRVCSRERMNRYRANRKGR